MSQEPWELRRYVDKDGRCPFDDWSLSLDPKTRARVETRLGRLRIGNFGDHKPLGDGVYELRFFFGAEYRIYYAISGKRVVLLLAGGNKKDQTKDIKTAKRRWRLDQS